MAVRFNNTWAMMLACCFNVSVIQATEFEYETSLVYAKYENINHVREPEEDENSRSILAEFSLIENRADLQADINVELEIIDYYRDLASDRADENIDVEAIWLLSPGRFSWYLSDVYRQITIDSLLPDTPDNEQNTNALSTGPNYRLHVNRHNNIDLEGRYETFYFEQTNADNDRLNAAARWLYEQTSIFTLGVNYEMESVFFDTNDIYNYDRYDVFFSLDYRVHMNTYVMELGSTNITSEYVDDFQETRYLLAVHNERNSSATASLEFIYSIEDTGRGLLESDEFESEYDLVSVVSTDLFVNKEYRMTYDRSFHVSEMDITISHIESDYIEQNNLDRTRSNLLLVFSRELTGGSDFTLEAGRSHIDYTTLLPERKDDIYRYSALYSYNARRNINLDYQVIYQEQKSTIYDLNYNDTRFMISLIYFSN